MTRHAVMLLCAAGTLSCGRVAAPAAASAGQTRRVAISGTEQTQHVQASEQAATVSEVAQGTGNEEPAAAPSRLVLFSTGRITWVYERPNTDGRKLGYLSVGQPVTMREAGRTPGTSKCLSGFYAIEPVGFVCASQNITTDPDDPMVAAMREAGPSGDRAYPFHYGMSLGAPMYNRLPNRRSHELVMMRYPAPRKRVGDWAGSFLDMDAGGPIVADSEVPSFLRDGKQSPNGTQGLVRASIPHSSLISYTRAFEYDGRVWVLAADLSVVPADRIVPYRRTAFHGVELGGEMQLPLAWACRAERRKLRARDDGGLERTGSSWEPREIIRLSGNTKQVRQVRYVESTDGDWIAASEVCEARGAGKLPEGIGETDRWIYLSMMEDTLVAYRGKTPVFATLHSPGRGGPHRGKGDVRHYTTPLGAFFINWKERWATLSPDPGAPTSFWISDVPGVQYFEQPYALHGAYWHERFGTPLSAGCPNLAPEDAVWLMDFTDPPIPQGWQAIGPARGQVGTMVVVGP